MSCSSESIESVILKYSKVSCNTIKRMKRMKRGKQGGGKLLLCTLIVTSKCEILISKNYKGSEKYFLMVYHVNDINMIIDSMLHIDKFLRI